MERPREGLLEELPFAEKMFSQRESSIEKELLKKEEPFILSKGATRKTEKRAEAEEGRSPLIEFFQPEEEESKTQKEGRDRRGRCETVRKNEST